MSSDYSAVISTEEFTGVQEPHRITTGGQQASMAYILHAFSHERPVFKHTQKFLKPGAPGERKEFKGGERLGEHQFANKCSMSVLGQNIQS